MFSSVELVQHQEGHLTCVKTKVRTDSSTEFGLDSNRIGGWIESDLDPHSRRPRSRL